jgi:hypothetical protein
MAVPFALAPFINMTTAFADTCPRVHAFCTTRFFDASCCDLPYENDLDLDISPLARLARTYRNPMLTARDQTTIPESHPRITPYSVNQDHRKTADCHTLPICPVTALRSSAVLIAADAEAYRALDRSGGDPRSGCSSGCSRAEVVRCVHGPSWDALRVPLLRGDRASLDRVH